MLRGPLVLAHQEVVFLEELKDVKDPELKSKLKAAAKSDLAEDRLLLSQDEAEQLLDTLPPPSEEDPAEVASARVKLRKFISQLEGNS